MNYNEAFEYYKSLQKDNIYCKALGAKINFTRRGWDHLRSGNKNRRKQKDINLRLKLLKSARYLIINAKTFSISTRNNVRFYTLDGVEIHTKNKIRVIIKKDPKNDYYFFSVMKT